MGGGTLKHWEKHLAEATWLVSARGSISRDGPAQSSSLRTVEGDKVPVVHGKSMFGKSSLGPSSLWKGQTSPWNCFCPGTWLHLVGDAERWGRSMCTTREFAVGGVQSVVLCVYIYAYRCVCNAFQLLFVCIYMRIY